jgi:uncharacterized caspase-like protein
MKTFWVLIATVLSGWANAALADGKVALVIGNSAYQNVGRLANPANDAAAIAAVLKNANFDVVDSRLDLSVVEMRKALREFAGKARNADVAVIYYAGHGIEIDGTNYLIPVDAQLEQDTDVYDEAFALERILVAAEPARQLRLVILDACRDNPFAKTMKRTVGSRAVGRGLAKVEPSSLNTMIAFAAKAGSTASDGDGKNSPFATALVNHLTKPGLDLRKAFGFVRDDVLRATGNKQEPFVYGSLGGNDVALVPPPAAAVAPAAPASAAPAAVAPVSESDAKVQRDYELALAIGTSQVWAAFVARYPSGFYTELAKAQHKKAASEEARVAATEKAKAALEEQSRLAAEGAKAAEQAKAATQAKAAEEARLAAEKKKALEEAKVAEAERAKAAAQAKAAEEARLAAERKKAADDAKAAEAERIRLAAQARATEQARIAEEKAAKDKEKEKAKEAKDETKDAAKDAAMDLQRDLSRGGADDRPVGPVAALTPPDQPNSQSTATDIPKLLQAELRRVGCNTGAVDGNWNAAAQKSMTLFNKHAGMKLDVKVASLDALDAIKTKTVRICPLVCDDGFRADGERCVKITCAPGTFLNDDNECERKREKPAVAREPRQKRDEREPARAQSAATKPAGSGQIMCGKAGCRPVGPGCRLERGMYAANVEVCK